MSKAAEFSIQESDDGVWFRFTASSGKSIMFNVNAMWNPLKRMALLDFAEDMLGGDKERILLPCAHCWQAEAFGEPIEKPHA